MAGTSGRPRVTVDTNRYSVPFRLIGRPVEVQRRAGTLRFLSRGTVVAEGTPEDVAAVPGSYTGRFLEEVLSAPPAKLSAVAAGLAAIRSAPPGALAGGQLGYNFQYNRLVFGIEASGSAADFDRWLFGSTAVNCCTIEGSR